MLRLINTLAAVVFVAVTFVLSTTVSGAEEQRYGPRIPTDYFMTTGVGQSDNGIPPAPYETFSYDIALKEAGIQDFNVVFYTSVIPKEAREIPFKEASRFFHHGSVLETIMARAGGHKGDTVAAGIGRIWAKDKQGNSVGGFAAEYERIYKRTRVSPEQAKKDARHQLTQSLRHELVIRGLEQDGDMLFEIDSLHITKNYGMVIAAMGFIGFIYNTPTITHK